MTTDATVVDASRSGVTDPHPVQDVKRAAASASSPKMSSGVVDHVRQTTDSPVQNCPWIQYFSLTWRESVL